MLARDQTSTEALTKAPAEQTTHKHIINQRPAKSKPTTAGTNQTLNRNPATSIASSNT
jgi:hypothetical protein